MTWCELLPEFFDVVKKHSRIVLHFARSATERCKILDKHLAILAPRHPETLFIKVDVEKCPFLCTRLNVQVPSPALLPFPPQVSSLSLQCERPCVLFEVESKGRAVTGRVTPGAPVRQNHQGGRGA